MKKLLYLLCLINLISLTSCDSTEQSSIKPSIQETESESTRKESKIESTVKESEIDSTEKEIYNGIVKFVSFLGGAYLIDTFSREEIYEKAYEELIRLEDGLNQSKPNRFTLS